MALVGDYLSSGVVVGDYIMSARCLLLFDRGDTWDELWELFTYFLDT